LIQSRHSNPKTCSLSFSKGYLLLGGWERSVSRWATSWWDEWVCCRSGYYGSGSCSPRGSSVAERRDEGCLGSWEQRNLAFYLESRL